MKVGRKPADATPAGARRASARPRPADKAAREAAARPGRRAGTAARRPHEPRGQRPGPQTVPAARPAERTARPKTADQAKARAKARKAKAPKVVRPPLRERLRERLVTRLITRLEGMDLRPQALLARIPFVVLVIGSLGLGLAITLWLSTDSAQRSYQLGNARSVNNALTEQKEALERDVLQAESAPALAEAARNLGMIPSKDTAHLVQDPAGNWVVVGEPKPAAGAPPPPLNTKLPDPAPPAPPAPPAKPAPVPGTVPGAEVLTRLTPPLPGALPAGPVPAAAAVGDGVVPQPVTGAGDTLANTTGGLVLVPLPTVAAVPPATDVTVGPAVVPPAVPLAPPAPVVGQ